MLFKETLKISQAGAKGREKDKSKILEELRRDRQRREEEARREKAAIKLQKALRPWIEKVQKYSQIYEGQLLKRLGDMKKIQDAGLPTAKYRAVCTKALDYFAEMLAQKVPFTALARHPQILPQILELFKNADLDVIFAKLKSASFYYFVTLTRVLACAGFPQYFKQQFPQICNLANSLIEATPINEISTKAISFFIKDPLFLPQLSHTLQKNGLLKNLLLKSIEIYLKDPRYLQSQKRLDLHEYILRLPSSIFNLLLDEVSISQNSKNIFNKLSSYPEKLADYQNDESVLQLCINLFETLQRIVQTDQSKIQLWMSLICIVLNTKEDFIQTIVSEKIKAEAKLQEQMEKYQAHNSSDEDQEEQEKIIKHYQKKTAPEPKRKQSEQKRVLTRHLPMIIEGNLLANLAQAISGILKQQVLIPINANLLHNENSVAFYVRFLRLLSILEKQNVLQGATHSLHNVLLQDIEFAKTLYRIIEESSSKGIMGQQAVLQLFCNLYEHTLLVVDDFQFKGERKSQHAFQLSLADLRHFAKYINRIALNLFSDTKSAKAKKSLRRSVRGLVKALYERERRCKLFEPEFWLQRSPYIPSNPKQKINYGIELNSIISNTPHCMPFSLRKRVLSELLKRDKNMHDAGLDYIYENGPNYIHIRRQFIVQDAFFKVLPQNREFKKIVHISFVDQFGNAEPGIDGGGLFKEFLTLFCRKIFDPDVGYFVETPEHTLTPNPLNLIGNSRQKHFQVIGMMVGKAIYEGVLIEPCLSRVFLNKVQGRMNSADDLEYIDPELHKNLMSLKWMKNVQDLGLFFTIDKKLLGGQTVTIPLIPRGEQIMVTEANKRDFIFLTANYKLNLQIEQQANAFRKGLSHIIPEGCLDLFNPDELLRLISGDVSSFSIEELRETCEYHGYCKDSPTITRFWKLLERFSEKEKKQFLLFVTGCSRPPLMGFESLSPSFGISRVDSRNNTMLPESSTCVNLLRLPDYSSEVDLQTRLRVAMENSEGFGLA